MLNIRILLSDAIGVFSYVLSYLIFADVIISWLPPVRNSKLGKFIDRLTSPILNPVRQLIYKSPLGGPGMVLDFSPFLTILAIQFIAWALRKVLLSF